MPELIYERPPLYRAQRLAIFDGLDVDGAPARFSFIEASTKAGKTVGCIAWLFEQALTGREGDNYWWVAPVYQQAKIAFRRMKRGVPRELIHVNNQELTITLVHTGAVISFRSAEKPDNLYGDDVRAAVIDEASRAREAAWHAIRSTLTATRGLLRCIGNVKGRKNWFYNLARQAEAGEPGMSYAKLTAWDAVSGGVLDKGEIEDARRQLPEAVFNELYLAEASDDGGNPFGLAAIARCVKPLSENVPVVIGADLAKSQDWTVVIGLDRSGQTCGFSRWQKVPWAKTTRDLVEIIGYRPALVDSTGVGDPVVESLQDKCPEVEGYQFTATSKQKLMEGLVLAIHSGHVSFPDGAIRAELETFEYQYTRTGVRYSAPPGFHDDCVMALALATEQLRRTRPGVFVEAVVAPNSQPWHDQVIAQRRNDGDYYGQEAEDAEDAGVAAGLY
jgi:hypothetical protein